MLRIRLQRMGKKKQPTYRLIVSERTKDTQAGSLEILGHYNPVTDPKVIEFKEDRIKYWISKGAEPSNSVNNLLIKLGIIQGKTKKVVTISNKRQAKLDEKKAVEEEKVAAKITAEKEVEVETPTETSDEVSVETPTETPAEVVEDREESVEEEIVAEKAEPVSSEATANKEEIPAEESVDEKVDEKNEETQTETPTEETPSEVVEDKEELVSTSSDTEATTDKEESKE